MIALNRYQSESAARVIHPFAVSTGSFVRAKSVVLDRLEEVIVAVEDMDWESFLKYVNFPIVCLYPDSRTGLTSPDPVNTAFKIDGYLSPEPTETRKQAFDRAKAECLHNLRNSLNQIRLYQRH